MATNRQNALTPITINNQDALGNVMATTLDRRQPYSSGDDTYKPYIVSTTDYYPFGYPISNRSPNTEGYRYFFNRQEADNEMFGIGWFQNYEFRMYDTRIARFWGVDPLTKDYPMMTPFQFASCSPILLVDVKGLEGIENTLGTYSQFFQFLFDSWEKYNPFLFDEKKFDSKTSSQNTNDNEKFD